jgi:CHAT domain-containing protein
MVEAWRTEWRQTKNKFLSQVRKMKHPVGKLNWGDLRREKPYFWTPYVLVGNWL